jgi:hypothetical protein
VRHERGTKRQKLRRPKLNLMTDDESLHVIVIWRLV